MNVAGQVCRILAFSASLRPVTATKRAVVKDAEMSGAR